MSERYRIFGSELSPYSVKVRSYVRYKGIPHEWIVRSASTMEEYRKYAKLPLIPLVVTPDGRGIQDSTPILEQLEAQHPEPSIHPPDAPAAFVSSLLEEYGDEWGNKPMFHYRWSYEADRVSAANRIARDLLGDVDAAAIEAASAQIRERMVPRLSLVGSTAATRPTIEASLERQLAVLDRHLAQRPYLFGGRPAFGDFGLFAQLYECSTDPTPRAHMEAVAPCVLAWITRMLAPRAEGPFETWGALEPTLRPLLADEVGALFLPWSDANARALAAGEKEFTVTLDGRPWTQEVQKYHAKSLAALRARYAACPDRARIEPILGATGCLQWLQ